VFLTYLTKSEFSLTFLQKTLEKIFASVIIELQNLISGGHKQ